MNIGSAIKRLRKEKEITQQQLADHSELSRIYISQIENGAKPSDEAIKKICTALKIPESLVYISGLEKEDIGDDKKELYDKLFPVIQNLIEELI